MGKFWSNKNNWNCLNHLPFQYNPHSLKKLYGKHALWLPSFVLHINKFRSEQQMLRDGRSNNYNIFSRICCKFGAEWLWKYGSRSKVMHSTHSFVPVTICAKYGKNPFRIVSIVKPMPQDVSYLTKDILRRMAGWSWRYRLRSKTNTRFTLSHVIDHVCQP